MKIFKVGLVGVTGYTGMELARLLASHPRMSSGRCGGRTAFGAAGRPPERISRRTA